MGGYNFAQLRILLVDDNDFFRQVMSQILLSLGVRHLSYEKDPEKALELAKAVPFDLIFVDWVMSPFTGLVFTKTIRMKPDGVNALTPIVMTTSYSTAEHVTKSRDAGSNAFLMKPITARSVSKCMTQLIEKPKPFIRTATYCGPDRRFKIDTFEGEDRRGQGTEPTLIKKSDRLLYEN